MSAHPDCLQGASPHEPHDLSSGNATKAGTRCEGTERLDVDRFPIDYRRRMIRAYPGIARMTSEEEWQATARQRNEAFQRILDNRNLRRTHELYLEVREEWKR